MRKHFKREVISHRHVLQEIKCDCCKVDIHETDLSYFFEVVTSHSRWGVDSWDSRDNFDFCSLKCLTEHMNSFFDNPAETDNYEIEVVSKSKAEVEEPDPWFGDI